MSNQVEAALHHARLGEYDQFLDAVYKAETLQKELGVDLINTLFEQIMSEGLLKDADLVRVFYDDHFKNDAYREIFKDAIIELFSKLKYQAFENMSSVFIFHFSDTQYSIIQHQEISHIASNSCRTEHELMLFSKYFPLHPDSIRHIINLTCVSPMKCVEALRLDTNMAITSGHSRSFSTDPFTLGETFKKKYPDAPHKYIYDAEAYLDCAKFMLMQKASAKAGVELIDKLLSSPLLEYSNLRLSLIDLAHENIDAHPELMRVVAKHEARIINLIKTYQYGWNENSPNLIVYPEVIDKGFISCMGNLSRTTKGAIESLMEFNAIDLAKISFIYSRHSFQSFDEISTISKGLWSLTSDELVTAYLSRQSKYPSGPYVTGIKTIVHYALTNRIDLKWGNDGISLIHACQLEDIADAKNNTNSAIDGDWWIDQLGMAIETLDPNHRTLPRLNQAIQDSGLIEIRKTRIYKRTVVSAGLDI